MTWFARLRQRWGRRPPVIPVMIDGKEYTVTEWARAAAARNMKLDPEKKAAVVTLLESQHPGRGEELARERYPEAWE